MQKEGDPCMETVKFTAYFDRNSVRIAPFDSLKGSLSTTKGKLFAMFAHSIKTTGNVRVSTPHITYNALLTNSARTTQEELKYC
jgi:hypothetical protein